MEKNKNDKYRLGHFELSPAERKEWNDMFKEFDVKVAEPEKHEKKKKKRKKKKAKEKKVQQEHKVEEVKSKNSLIQLGRCTFCGSEDVIRSSNGDRVCLDCHRILKVEVIDCRACELQKIWKYKGETHIKIVTILGSRSFVKLKGGLYEEFTYSDYEVFEKKKTGNVVDFTDALNYWLY